MTAIQIVRTVGLALLLGGLALGLFPMGEGGECGSGWVNAIRLGCGPVMAPVGSWAVALVVVGGTMLTSAWINTRPRPLDQKPQQTR